MADSYRRIQEQNKLQQQAARSLRLQDEKRKKIAQDEILRIQNNQGPML